MRFFASPEYKIAESIPVTTVGSATATNGSWVDISGYIGDITVNVYASAMSASDTLDFTVQMSLDASTPVALTAADLIDENGDAATFTQVTDAASSNQTLYVRTTGLVYRYLRVVGTTAGSTVTGVFGASFGGQLKYSEDN